jgi:hypothetical protein
MHMSHAAAQGAHLSMSAGVERNFAILRNDAHQLHFVVHQLRWRLGVLTPSARGACATTYVPRQQFGVHFQHQQHMPCSEHHSLDLLHVDEQALTTDLVPCAGVAHLDLLKYFNTVTHADADMELRASEALAESSLLMRTSETPLPACSAAGKSHRAYTLQLPLVNSKRSAADIVADTEAEDVNDEEQEYIQIRLEPADVGQVEESFWTQLVALSDWDHTGVLAIYDYLIGVTYN